MYEQPKAIDDAKNLDASPSGTVDTTAIDLTCTYLAWKN